MAIVALLMALFHSVAASAADTWSVNPSAYRYDMSLYLDVVFGTGEKLDYTQYDVATFVGDECRGVAEVLPLPPVATASISVRAATASVASRWCSAIATRLRAR